MNLKGHGIKSKVFDLPYRLQENLILLLRELIKVIYDKIESVPFNDLAFSMEFMIEWLEDRVEKEGVHTQETFNK